MVNTQLEASVGGSSTNLELQIQTFLKHWTNTWHSSSHTKQMWVNIKHDKVHKYNYGEMNKHNTIRKKASTIKAQ